MSYASDPMARLEALDPATDALVTALADTHRQATLDRILGAATTASTEPRHAGTGDVHRRYEPDAGSAPAPAAGRMTPDTAATAGIDELAAARARRVGIAAPAASRRSRLLSGLAIAVAGAAAVVLLSVLAINRPSDPGPARFSSSTTLAATTLPATTLPATTPHDPTAPARGDSSAVRLNDGGASAVVTISQRCAVPNGTAVALRLSTNPRGAVPAQALSVPPAVVTGGVWTATFTAPVLASAYSVTVSAACTPTDPVLSGYGVPTQTVAIPAHV